MFSPVRQATLLYPTGDKGQDHHLLILLTDPFGPAKQVLLVPICSVRGVHDNSCLLVAGDHEFIKQESFVSYALARVEPAAWLVDGVNKRLFIDKGLLETKIFQRVLAGLGISKFTKPFAKVFFMEFEKYRNRQK